MPVAITRAVSPAMNECELSFVERRTIDVERAAAQHRAYCECLIELGARIVALPADPSLPDSVFVEDTAVVVDEGAVITRPGAASRRPEVIAVAETLRRYRPLAFMEGPGTLDGGDVMRVGRTLYVGRTARTTAEGASELAALVAPLGYDVRPVDAWGCLHLKSGCTYVGRDTVLANPAWVDPTSFAGVDVVEVAESEPFAANTVLVGDTVVLSAACPETAATLARRGFDVRLLDVSEIGKAEGGLSCMSLLLA